MPMDYTISCNCKLRSTRTMSWIFSNVSDAPTLFERTESSASLVIVRLQPHSVNHIEIVRVDPHGFYQAYHWFE